MIDPAADNPLEAAEASRAEQLRQWDQLLSLRAFLPDRMGWYEVPGGWMTPNGFVRRYEREGAD